jgi:hypothetical protein
MSTKFNFQSCFLVLLLLLFIVKSGEAQMMSRLSFSNAYNLINTGTQSSSSSVMNRIAVSQPGYSHAVKVGYGIPIEIALEYAVVKSNLSSEIASDPANYFNSSDDVQQAFSNIAYGDFVTISSYNQVNVVLNFRFNPAELKIYGNVEEEFINNSVSSPYDPAVYRMPSTPVKGTKILVIKK